LRKVITQKRDFLKVFSLDIKYKTSPARGTLLAMKETAEDTQLIDSKHY